VVIPRGRLLPSGRKVPPSADSRGNLRSVEAARGKAKRSAKEEGIRGNPRGYHSGRPAIGGPRGIGIRRKGRGTQKVHKVAGRQNKNPVEIGGSLTGLIRGLCLKDIALSCIVYPLRHTSVNFD